jgi:hypothetical protein
MIYRGIRPGGPVEESEDELGNDWEEELKTMKQ